MSRNPNAYPFDENSPWSYNPTDLGAGECAVSLTNAGMWEPQTSPRAQTSLWLDPDTGKQGDAARINPVTRDYEVDDYGNILGWSSLKQRVYLALVTKLKSSADRKLGIDLSFKVISAQTFSRIRVSVNNALKRMVDRKEIEVVKVDIKRVPGTSSALSVEVSWRDIQTGELFETQVQ